MLSKLTQPHYSCPRFLDRPINHTFCSVEMALTGFPKVVIAFDWMQRMHMKTSPLHLWNLAILLEHQVFVAPQISPGT